MDKITRREFINGSLIVAGVSMLPTACINKVLENSIDPSYYPPALTGLRGSHPGSNTHAHDRAWAKKTVWGSSTELNEAYDLIVVGGGISGLAAAYFYQQKHGLDSKILIIDNHDDFGGHAKRNEHTIDGQLRLAYGGSQSIVEPQLGSEEVHALLKDIGIDVERFQSDYDKEFFKKNNLGAVTYFNKEVFGEDKVVRHPFCNYPNYIEGIMMHNKLSNEEATQKAPLSEKGKEQLLRILNGGLHAINVNEDKLEEYIGNTSYFNYLKNDLDVDDPLVLSMARNSGLDWASSGTDVMSISQAKSCGAMGFTPKPVYDEEHPYIYHFPDGNASIARALVKKIVPGVADVNNTNELLLAKFKYHELDNSENAVRIRLNSTVVDVHHAGNLNDSSEVLVNYIKDNKSHLIKSKNVVMACYNMVIPHIVSDLPEEQAKALRQQTKSPLIYTTVGLRNWKALKEMEIGMAMSPGNMHQAVLMDFPVNIGEYKYSKSPNDPCVLQMISCPYGSTIGAPAIEQYREVRYKMLAMQFKDYEKEIRSHLNGMLDNDLFDFDRDVESITVNRWAHGYTVSGPGDTVKIGRKAFGRISIANCDSGGNADMKTAIDMASRAINDLD